MIGRALLCFLIACSSSSSSKSWRPASNADELVLRDDLVIRGEADGATSVTATVTLDEITATGHVRLRVDARAAATSEHVRLARARAWHVVSAQALQRGKPELAFAAAKHGCDELRCCVRNGSDRPARLAEALAMERRHVDAAEEMTKALRGYLRGYLHRFHTEVL